MIQVPLRTVDKFNVVFTAASLGIVSAIMIVALVWALAQLNPSQWSVWEKLKNFGKVILVLVLCGLLLRFAILSLQEAFSFTILNDKNLPSNLLLGIPICEEETKETSADYCDEKSFLIRVLFAWLAAGYLCFFLFFRAAPLDESTLPTTNLSLVATRTGGNGTERSHSPDGNSTHVGIMKIKEGMQADYCIRNDSKEEDGDSSCSVGEDCNSASGHADE